MEQSIKKNGLINLLILLVVGAAAFGLARYGNALTGQIAAYFLGMGLLTAVISFFQMGLEDNERLEKMELDEMAKSRGASLFSAGESELLPARKAREQFERFFVPGFAIVLFILQAGGAYWLWRWLPQDKPEAIQEPLLVMAMFGLFFLALFLLGRYTAGLVRLEKRRLLSAAGNYLLFGAYLSALSAAAVATVEYGKFPYADVYAARALCVILTLVAVENILTLIFEIYRPRVKGKESRLLYDSRLIGLMSQPESLFSAAAHTLDYQFGFKVSETWLFQRFKEQLPMLLMAQGAILLLSTCFVFIEPGEQAMLERFGRLDSERPVLKPGGHLKLPWPIDRVYRYPTYRIQSFDIGFVRGGPEGKTESRVALWTQAHYQSETRMLVASREQEHAATVTPADEAEKSVPVSLLVVNVPVQFEVTNLLAWATNYIDSDQLLQNSATRDVVDYLAGKDLEQIMTTGREELANELRDRIQKHADELGLGVNIMFVGVQGIHPPTEVAKDFEDVVGALQEKEAKVLQAQGYQASTLPKARADATNRIHEATAYATRILATDTARAEQFNNQLLAYRAAPQFYVSRAYLQTLERGLVNTRLCIVGATNTDGVLILNLEDTIGRGVLEAGLQALQKPK